MPRSKRREFSGAIHLVTVSGYPDGHVFYHPSIFNQFLDNARGRAPDAEYFESLLWETCEQYEGRIHAYIIEPNASLIVFQTHSAHLSWFMHDLLARYSMYLIEHTRIPRKEKPFPHRYKAQIVQPAKLPYAVRYIHRRRISSDLRRRAVNHPFSSNLIYCGRRPPPNCFVTHTAQQALVQLGYPGPHGYFEFMARDDSPAIAYMLSQAVIGEKSFAESLCERCRIPAKVPSPDEILREVTGSLLYHEPSVACSSTHLGALARALVAWYAMRSGAARISAVAAWFGVTSSELRYLIRRHRHKHPQYFSKSLPELFPNLISREALPPHSCSLGDGSQVVVHSTRI